MSATAKNYYQVLGITRTATADELKHAYRMLAMKHHPDKNQGDKQSEELFKEIQEAYQVLSDLEKRKKYDSAKSWNFTYSYFQQVRHYFIVHCDSDHMKLNEEFKLTYTYTGEGRFFRKPSLDGFFITGKPFVSFRMILIEGTEVRETSLEYILAPMHTGDRPIDSASIRIQNDAYFTKKLAIHVVPNFCFYKKGAEAGLHPFRYIMNTKIESGTETHHITYHQNHTVLIPRSEVARYYHNIGSIIKIGSAIWGFFLFSISGWNEFLGIFTGSLFGGVCCHAFYLLAGVKSRFYYSTQYPLVLSYKAKGYEKGRYSGSDYITGNLTSWFSDLMS